MSTEIYRQPGPSITYIGGYGRSGSTLLDTLLGNHPDIFGAGELTWLFKFAAEGGGCTCGRTISDCEFWKEVLDRVFASVPHLDRATAAEITLDSERVWGNRDRLHDYSLLWSATFRAIAEISGASVVVDSSKTSRLAHHRFALLRDRLGVSTRLIHLVRDARGVMWSARRGSNRALEASGRAGLRGISGRASMCRGLFGWIYSNSVIERCGTRSPPTTTWRLRYEDLVTEPQRVLYELGEFIGEPMQQVQEMIERSQAFAPGHGVAGNRMRRKGSIQLRIDDEWQRSFPADGRLLSLFALPWLRHYSYV